MKTILLMAILALASGCATVVTNDYPAYLAKNQGQTYPAVDYDAQYLITPSTKSHSLSISSFMAGAGNSWEVKFGPLLDATLRSSDVQKSFKSFTENNGTDKAARLITFHLNSYNFANHRATIDLKITATKNGKTILDKSYRADGVSQGGKMFWGGGMAMKNAVQQSTKSAMDTILINFFADLKAAN